MLNGKREDEKYELFKASKTWLGRTRGKLKWFKKYEEHNSVSTSTGWDRRNGPNGIIIDGEHGNGSSIKTAKSLNKGVMEINYNMYGEPDKMVITNTETGDVLFNTASLKSADNNGKVQDKNGSGLSINFDLGERIENGKKIKNTSITITINSADNVASTVYKYMLRISLSDSKSKLNETRYYKIGKLNKINRKKYDKK
jgi:hypothetical protein